MSWDIIISNILLFWCFSCGNQTCAASEFGEFETLQLSSCSARKNTTGRRIYDETQCVFKNYLCLGVKSDHWWGMHFSNVGKKSVKYTSLQMVVYVWGFPKRPLDLLKITLLSWEAWHVTTIFDWEDSILKVVQWNTDGQCLLMLLKYRGHLQWCFGLWLCGWTTFILNPSTERIWKDIQ